MFFILFTMTYIVHCEYLDDDNTINEDFIECDNLDQVNATIADMSDHDCWGIQYTQVS